MNKREFAKIAAAMRIYYPKDNLLPTKESMSLWYAELKDMSYEAAVIALRRHVSSCKFAPTIAELREQAIGTSKSWGQAWGEVVNAIHKYGQYEQAKALREFDEATRHCVERIGFKDMCMSSDLKADRANFRIMYEQEIKREREWAKLPKELKKKIAELSAAEILELE